MEYKDFKKLSIFSGLVFLPMILGIVLIIISASVVASATTGTPSTGGMMAGGISVLLVSLLTIAASAVCCIGTLVVSSKLISKSKQVSPTSLEKGAMITCCVAASIRLGADVLSLIPGVGTFMSVIAILAGITLIVGFGLSVSVTKKLK